MHTKFTPIITTTLAASLLFLSGCFTPPTQAEYETQVAQMGYGSELPSDWQEKIKTFMEMRLKDAGSALWKFDADSIKSWAASSSGKGTRIAAGHFVTAYINAKNSYGGYIGYQEYTFCFRDGRIIAYAKGRSGYEIL